ncbi:Protoheme IX farnesyltransferase 2 [archaeon HR01]|nr:Protoheme IX farnesyltransferase 2 [archaeon HR01]
MNWAAYIRMTRPPNSILMYLAVLVGVLFSDSRNLTPATAVLSFATAYGLNGASMVVNDYFDRETDAVNRPERPIPSGAVKPAEAIRYSILLTAVGLAASALTSPACLAVASAAYLTSFLYNWRLKKAGLLGNSLVSVDVVAPFIYGAVLSDGYINPRVLVFTLLAFLANNGREVVKGISDVEGDRLRDVRTVAALYGGKAAAVVGAAHYMAAVALSPLPYLLGYVGLLYLPIVAAADAGFTYTSIAIVRRPIEENAIRQKRLTLLWMFIALLAFALGGLYLG